MHILSYHYIVDYELICTQKLGLSFLNVLEDYLEIIIVLGNTWNRRILCFYYVIILGKLVGEV